MCRDGGKRTRRWCKVSRTASRTVTGGLQDLGKLRIVGVALISLVGLIHLLVTPDYYGFAAYLGLLMIANFAESMVSTLGIYQGRTSRVGRWGCPGFPPGSRLRSHRAFSPSFWRRFSWGWPRTCLAGRGGLPLPLANLCNSSHSTMP
jgi:hypothetical protein